MAQRAEATATNFECPFVAPCDSTPGERSLSAWSRSRGKRWFDVLMVVAAMPVVVPVCLLIAVAVRFSSQGPVLFVQKRIGRGGKRFSILKFRTMLHFNGGERGSITTIHDDHITAVGRVLRTYKLDELPQLINVLRGEMSLVGPRPLVPQQAPARLDCRPGITGAASLEFVREEALLADVPRHQLASYYASRVLPLKREFDDAYMAQASFASDLRILLLTVVRVWISPAQLAPGTQRNAGVPLHGASVD